MRASAGSVVAQHALAHQRGDHAHRAGPDGDGVEQLHVVGVGVDAVLAGSQHLRDDALGALAGDDLAGGQLRAVQPGEHPEPSGGDVGDAGDLPVPVIGIAEIPAPRAGPPGLMPFWSGSRARIWPDGRSAPVLR